VPNVKIAIQTRSLRQPLRQAMQTAAQLGAEGIEIDARNELPPFVSIPGSTGYWESAGYLEPKFNPFDAGNPNSEKYQVRDLELPLGVDWARMDHRRSLLKIADDKFRQYDSQNLIENMNSYYQTAFGLMQSARAKKAFLIGEESEKLRDAYAKESDSAKQKAIAEQVSLRLSAAYPTFAPLGQFTTPTAIRANVTGLLQTPSLALWNVEKK